MPEANYQHGTGTHNGNAKINRNAFCKNHANKSNRDIADAFLIKRYLETGDTSSFNLLYNRYKNQIYSYLIGMLGNNKYQTDDIFQQAWIRIIHSLHRYQPRQKFLAWAIRIAHNLCIDYFRKEKRFVRDDCEETTENIPDLGSEAPWEGIDRVFLMEKLSVIVSELPELQREVFLLRQQGISFKEIASVQNTSVNTALGRMQYALKKIQEKMSSLL